MLHVNLVECASTCAGDAVRLPAKPSGSNIIHCYDPATMETFGYAKAMSADEASLWGLKD